MSARPNTSADASSKLRELLEASDEAELDRNPIYGIFRGDLRRAAVYGDYISEAYVAAEMRRSRKRVAGVGDEFRATVYRDKLSASPIDAFPLVWRANALERNSPPASLDLAAAQARPTKRLARFLPRVLLRRWHRAVSHRSRLRKWLSAHRRLRGMYLRPRGQPGCVRALLLQASESSRGSWSTT